MTYEYIKQALYEPSLSWPVIFLILGVAFVLGALHALGPGHGKGLMAAYLVGSKGRIIDAVVLALTLTISHVASVILLGFITLWISDFFMPEKMSKWFGFISGLSIVGIGLWLLVTRLKAFRQLRATDKKIPIAFHHHDHVHLDVGVTQDNSHHHYQGSFSFWQNVALGISGGIVPCPKALVILLLAISLQKIALGITIIIVFSLGLSFVLITLGIVMLKAAYLLKDRLEDQRIQIFPLIGAILILILGTYWTIRALVLIV
ncbi:sulfite exporter TauE/SafE family protein [candidate division KSB1 bacterium]|nr:sulfite exporter TauE/SafE family protein [candidate division KSB1 bacterium]